MFLSYKENKVLTKSRAKHSVRVATFLSERYAEAEQTCHRVFSHSEGSISEAHVFSAIWHLSAQEAHVESRTRKEDTKCTLRFA
eukprot:3435830-Amphidinium_carterae.1